MTPEDFVEIFDKHASDLMRFCTALVGPSGAEDLLATAAERALPTQRLDDPEHQRAYLFRIVLNEARRSHRATTRRMSREVTAARRQPASDHLVPEGPGSDLDVLAALRRLTPRQRAVVFLTYWGDYTPAAVATELDLSLRTVERELRAAKRRLEYLLS